MREDKHNTKILLQIFVGCLKYTNTESYWQDEWIDPIFIKYVGGLSTLSDRYLYNNKPFD
jgi:hypothetical protein